MRKLFIILSILISVIAVALITIYFVFFDRVEGQYFQSDGARIHYTVQGQGEPVILLHGFAVNADLNWRVPGIIAALSEDFKVIAMDLRSHGLSGKPHNQEQYGLQMTADVVNLLDHLDIEKAHLAGYSLGGFIALKTASRYPGRWHKVIAMGAGWENPRTSTAMKALAQAGKDLEKYHAINPIIGYFEDRKEPGWVHKVWVRLMTGWFNDWRALVAMIDAAPQLTMTKQQLHQISAPVYCIIGQNDPLLPGAKALKDELPRTTMFVVPHATHMSAPGNELTHQKLVEFLRRDR